MRRHAVLPAIALLAAVLVVAGCSSSEVATTTPPAPATTGGPNQYRVVMESFAFTPAELTVPVGATVTWVNRHAANHDVVADDGTFASPLFGTGETYSFTFTESGQYPYRCSIHPSMRGTIIVTTP
jgi:plastocyanin